MITNTLKVSEALKKMKHQDIIQFCDAWFGQRGTIKANGFDLTPSARIMQIIGTLKYGFSVASQGLTLLGMDQIAGRARRAVEREIQQKASDERSEWLLG